MLPGKVAVPLLLLFAAISLGPVSAGCCFRKPCTVRQKDHIVDTCRPYILKTDHRVLPRKTDLCCREVRTLQSMGEGMMQCVVDLLTDHERAELDVTVVLYLKRYCTQPSSPAPPNEVRPCVDDLFNHISPQQHASSHCRDLDVLRV
ncbi:hypothetical protein BS78_05G112500 [Paspalum vaginatum]|nr:hypothetical protein BS78_05G112500 [Paspalum vaginatum]